ncbi:MAG TPA: hypothetical protein VK168_03325 [Saprospiraceae bacterium]|nr:hypothetical protein [Saprospiraceae bacterium]
MTVSIIGIKGYEYQYKITVLISLICNAEKIKLFVEKEGSEDALLVLEEKGIVKKIEIQVKRENNLIDISKLVQWLCHFQEKRSDSNLLQKLIDNKTVTALFVTHSRCSDDIVFLKKEIKDINWHKNISITNKWKEDFITSLKSLKLGQTELKQQRELFCHNQAKTLNVKNELPKLLEQCLIWEELSDEKVDTAVNILLNKKYNIAQSETENIYLKLLEIVRLGRDEGSDIIDNIKKTIQLNKIGMPILSSNYEPRIEEPQFINYLAENSILLLTGISQCGKSEIAKKIAINFFEKGFDYKITDSIEDTKRFLTTNISDNKIVVLEDPFGHILPIPDLSTSKRKIQDIIPNIPSHHKLIITSRIEILYEVFETDDINDCKFKNYKWHDLTIKDSSIMNAYWKTLSKSKSLPNELTECVSKGLLNSKSEHVLQLGQLNYLINEEVSNLSGKKYSEIEHIARRDSKEIALNIKKSNEYAAEILSVIAMCSNSINGICIEDLAYIVSDSQPGLSIIQKDVFTSSFEKKTPKFPEYPEGICLSNDAENAIIYLEERQFIFVKNDVITLRHPNYYESGRYLFQSKSEVKLKNNINLLSKCISCLNPINAYLASKQLAFIYDSYKKSDTLKMSILKLAFEGLGSIFPAVEDNSLIFLMNIIEDLDDEQSQIVVREIQSGGTSRFYIYWHKGVVPFISTSGEISIFSTEPDSKLIENVEDELLENKLPNIRDGWAYIDNLKYIKQVPLDSLKILLQYNEAFIRKEVVYQIFNRIKIINKDIITEVFKDEHPDVVFSAIRASLINWFSLTQEFKDLVTSLIFDSLKKTQIAIRAFNLLSTFSVDYSHEAMITWRDLNVDQRRELWNLWADLYPIVARNVPFGTYINTPRFGASMNEAIKYLDADKGILVLNSWFDRIDYQIKKGKILDEFEMAVADDLMKLTGNDWGIRKDLFSRLVNYNDTIFVLSNLKWIISYWDKLDISEKEQIYKLVQSGRKDIRWIKSVLLTCDSPPKEICLLILAEREAFNKGVEYFLSSISDQLIRDCLNMYCGFPQPFWWLAVHHKNSKFWNDVINYILLDEDHTGFDICLQEFLNQGVNGFSNDWNDWKRIWERVCQKTTKKELLVNSLIYNTANCSCNLIVAHELWSILIKSYSSIDKEDEIISIISENIELIQQTGHKEDLFSIFTHEFLINKIIPKLIPDIILIDLLIKYKSNSFFNDGKTINFITKITEVKNIRFFGTFNFFKNLGMGENISNEVKEALLSLPNIINVIGKKELEEKRKKHEYRLGDWIGKN